MSSYLGGPRIAVTASMTVTGSSPRAATPTPGGENSRAGAAVVVVAGAVVVVTAAVVVVAGMVVVAAEVVVRAIVLVTAIVLVVPEESSPQAAVRSAKARSRLPVLGMIVVIPSIGGSPTSYPPEGDDGRERLVSAAVVGSVLVMRVILALVVPLLASCAGAADTVTTSPASTEFALVTSTVVAMPTTTAPVMATIPNAPDFVEPDGLWLVSGESSEDLVGVIGPERVWLTTGGVIGEWEGTIGPHRMWLSYSAFLRDWVGAIGSDRIRLTYNEFLQQWVGTIGADRVWLTYSEGGGLWEGTIGPDRVLLSFDPNRRSWEGVGPLEAAVLVLVLTTDTS